jgi:hypothetical protein
MEAFLNLYAYIDLIIFIAMVFIVCNIAIQEFREDQKTIRKLIGPEILREEQKPVYQFQGEVMATASTRREISHSRRETGSRREVYIVDPSFCRRLSPSLNSL